MLNGTSERNIVAAQYTDHVSIGHVLGCLVLTVCFCISGLVSFVMWHHITGMFQRIIAFYSLACLNPKMKALWSF